MMHTQPRSIKILIFMFLFSVKIFAEPWLAVRFSQNCAGCHAPGRKNKPAIDRRCALSCQGCHVNPNGGGLRSYYGQWNENRWLRSFKTEFLAQDSSFHKLANQAYDQLGQFRYKDSGITQLTADADKKLSSNKLQRLQKSYNDKKIVKSGLPLLTTQKFPMDEGDFTRDDHREKRIVESETEFMLQVSQDDPIRQLSESKIDGGADIRAIYQKELARDPQDTQDDIFFLMAADINLRYRPFYKKLHLVFEHRTFGMPNSAQNLDRLTQNNASRMKSAYVLMDDLPYNTFVMAGAYRPLFGYATADHTSLSQTILANGLNYTSGVPMGSAYNQLFEAMTIGAAPNVPYANLHYIRKNLGRGIEDWSGFGANAGLKFVKFGGNINYSILSATHEQTNGASDILAQSLVLGGMLNPRLLGSQYPIVANLEYMWLEIDAPTEKRNNSTISFDGYAKVWREFYLNIQYGTSNSTTSLADGSATQMRMGLKSFITAGVDWSLLYGKDENEVDASGVTPASNSSVSYIQSQLHLYF